MFELKNNSHVALILPTSGNDTSTSTTRRSLKRHWNQLSRFQRNIILMIIIAICVTLLLLIPGESVVSDLNKNEPEGHIRIAPYRDPHDKPFDIHPKPPIQQQQPLEEQQQQEQPQHQQSFDSNNSNNNRLDYEVKSGAAPPPNNVGDNILQQPQQQQQQQQQQAPPPPANAPVEINETNEINGIESNKIKNVLDSLDIPKIDNNDVRYVIAKPYDVPPIYYFKGPTNERQQAVVNAFSHAWKGYKEYAWGHDNLKPISYGSHDWFGLGLTIIDALDTMYIMNLVDEFDEARNWVDQHLKFDINREINLFEVTIRVLGGLLSTYHLSGDKMFLTKAVDLGERLLPCFNSPSGVPYSDVNLATLNAHSPKWSPDSSTSEVTTIQLEFRDLSRSTGNDIYEKVVSRTNEVVHNLEKKDGLVPIFINANTGTFRSFATISLGARGDSYYEYLLKQWFQTGKKEGDFLIEDYRTAIDGVIEHLVRKTPNEQHVYIGELISGKDFKPKMDHLTCYLPGTLLLGYKNGNMPESHFKLAEELLETCYQTYMKQPTKLAPEITYFNLNGESDSDMYVKSNDAHNLLRPEFIESLYYFYALSGNRTYQDMGWTIFQAFEKHTKVKGGYTSIGNVKQVLNTRPRDMMESFFLGETLKYFYLLFSDNRQEVDLTRWVFNSEAHLIPIRDTD